MQSCVGGQYYLKEAVHVRLVCEMLLEMGCHNDIERRISPN